MMTRGRRATPMAEDRVSPSDEEPARPDPTTMDDDAPGSDMGAGWQETVDDSNDRDESRGPGVGDVYRSGS